jgi:hypothetical protein
LLFHCFLLIFVADCAISELMLIGTTFLAPILLPRVIPPEPAAVTQSLTLW